MKKEIHLPPDFLTQHLTLNSGKYLPATSTKQMKKSYGYNFGLDSLECLKELPSEYETFKESVIGITFRNLLKSSKTLKVTHSLFSAIKALSFFAV